MHALELVYPSRILAWIIQRSLPFVSHVVAVSDYTKNELARYNYPSESISVIPHGAEHVRPFEADVDEYQRSKQQAKSALYSGLIDTHIPQTITEEESTKRSTIITEGDRLDTAIAATTTVEDLINIVNSQNWPRENI
jgi:hypothetical protein